MNELHLQDKFLIPFFRDGLGYQEVKANTVIQSLIIEEDLQRFISDFEKAIHITTTDSGETFVIRTIADYFDEMLATCREGKFDREMIEKKAHSVFKPYSLLNPDAEKKNKLHAVGEFFFKETEDLVDKLCDDFEMTIRNVQY